MTLIYPNDPEMCYNLYLCSKFCAQHYLETISRNPQTPLDCEIPLIFNQPKYINNLLKFAEARKKEDERRIERQVQKEREAEGDEFADKDAFVTSAYLLLQFISYTFKSLHEIYAQLYGKHSV